MNKDLIKELKTSCLTQRIKKEIKELVRNQDNLEYPEIKTLSDCKFKNLYSIYELSEKLKRKRSKEAKEFGEEVRAFVMNKLTRKTDRGPVVRNGSSEKDSKFGLFGRFKERMKHKLSSRTEYFKDQLRALGLENEKLMAAFFDGSLGRYVSTIEGKQELEKLSRDKEMFANYLKALRIPGAIEYMVDFLKTNEGIDAYVAVGKTEPGLEVLAEIGQKREGREVVKDMLKSPLHGWPAMFKILKKLAEETQDLQDEKVELPSFDLSFLIKSRNPAERILPLLRDNKQIGIIFVSFSESKENTELCCEILKDSKVREMLFNYLISNPRSSSGTFVELFKSAERRSNISDMFMSKGGAKLLVELAKNIEGRKLMTKLALSPRGRKTGIKVLMRNPQIIIKVGWSYFKEPLS